MMKNTNKKFLAFALSAIMTLGLGTTALANTELDVQNDLGAVFEQTNQVAQKNEFIVQSVPEVPGEDAEFIGEVKQESITRSFSKTELSATEFEKIVKAQPNVVESSEFDIVTQKIASAKEKIAKGDRSLDTIKLSEYDMAEEVYKLKSKTEQELNLMGFSEERVELIKDFEGSNMELRAISATLSASCTAGSMWYSSSKQRTYANFEYDFTWNSIPAFQHTDSVMVASTNGFFATYGTTTLYYKYWNGNGSYNKVVAWKENRAYSGGSSEVKVLDSVDYYGGNVKPYHISSGNTFVQFSKSGRNGDIVMAGEYAHNTLASNTSFFFTVSQNLINGDMGATATLRFEPKFGFQQLGFRSAYKGF